MDSFIVKVINKCIKHALVYTVTLTHINVLDQFAVLEYVIHRPIGYLLYAFDITVTKPLHAIEITSIPKSVIFEQ